MIHVDPYEVKSKLLVKLATMPYKPYGWLLHKIERDCWLGEYRATLAREAKYLRMLMEQGIRLTPGQEHIWRLYRNHRDRRNELNRRPNNIATRREYQRIYRMWNRGKIRKYKRDYYARHRERLNQLYKDKYYPMRKAKRKAKREAAL